MDKATYKNIRKTVSFEFSAPHFISQMGADIILVATITSLFFAGDFWAFLNIPLLSILYFRAFSLMHEAVHSCLIPHKKWNDCLGVLYGALCGLPFEQWKQSHLVHHYWAGNTDQDPVMSFVKHQDHLPGWLHKTLTTSWFLWIPFPAFIQNLLFWHLSLQQKAKTSFMRVSLAAPLLFAGILGGWALTSGYFLHIVASVYLYMMAVEIVNFPHHLQLPYLKDEERLPIWEQYQIARSCLYPKWFAQWIVLNFNYHSEHHMFPDAPWHTLPALHEKISAVIDLNTDPQFEFILRTHRGSFTELLRRKDIKPPKAA